MELALFLHNVFVELGLFCFDLTLGVSEWVGVVAPVALFLQSSWAHQIELVFEQGIDVSIPFSEVFTYSDQIIRCDQVRFIQIFLFLFFSQNLFNFRIEI